MEPLIGSGEAALLLGVNQKTLVRWARKGRIPAGRGPGGRYVFDPEVLARLLAEMREAASGDLAEVGA